MIQLNQNAWVRSCFDMNTDLRQKAKNDFEKDFSKLMKNSAFGKAMENVRICRDIKLVATERRRDYLVSEPNYHTAKFFIEHLLATEMEKTEMLMNKPAYLGLLILELSKPLMYEFWYDYAKPRYDEKAKFFIWKRTFVFILLYGYIRLMKDKLCGKMMTKFVGLRPKVLNRWQ